MDKEQTGKLRSLRHKILYRRRVTYDMGTDRYGEPCVISKTVSMSPRFQWEPVLDILLAVSLCLLAAGILLSLLMVVAAVTG